MSAPHSPSLSARRGSVSAPDPFGTHFHLQRPSTSTLTIVRVPSTTINLQEPPNGSKKFGRRPAAGAQTNSQHPNGAQPEGRLSFAFSSFSHQQPRPDGRSPSNSPNTSPRIRAASPHRFSSGIMSKPRLSAEQLVDLARQAVNARSAATTPQSPVSSHRPHSPHLSTSAPPIGHLAPPTFTPLPDDIYLPFIHRAEEVSQLISTPPSAKLFSLLSQAFRDKSERADAKLPENTVPPGDPAQWTYSQLIHHLTRVDRDVYPDADWVFAARRCIMSHSELIWERIKAALGVPPELDVDELEEEPPLSSFALDDSAIIDSPITEKFPLGNESTECVADIHRPSQSALGAASSADALLQAKGTEDPGAPTQQPAQDEARSLAPGPIGATSPVLSGDGDSETDHLIIEPLLSTSGHSSHPPPLSLPLSLSSDGGLGDIAEGAEEEAEEDGTDEAKQDDTDLVDPSQIQGLRISTGVRTPNESITNSPVFNGSTPSYAHGSGNYNDRLTSSNLQRSTSSESRLSSHITGPSSPGALRGLGGRSYRRTRPASMSNYDTRDWDIAYNPVGERGPGNPLFPSNFARLALGPTLQANNPALRSLAAPPASRYAPEITFHRGPFTTAGAWGHKARSQSWTVPTRGAQSESAITIASEGSVGE